MAFRTQDFRCAEHGVFEEIVDSQQLTAPCSQCGAICERTISTPALVNPKFVDFKHDTKRRASRWI